MRPAGCRQWCTNGKGGAFSLTDFLMAPPPAPGPPMHVHAEEEETVYLLGGDMEVTVAGVARKVSTGGAVHVPRVCRTRCGTWVLSRPGCW